MNTKNQVIDQQNKNNENVKQRIADVRRMSIETVSELSIAVIHAQDEIKGDRTTGEAILGSTLYCDLFEMGAMLNDRFLRHEQKKQQYQKMERHDLLRTLYQRLQTYYHYAECKGRELPGIKYHMEQNGVFAIDLHDCALNMEHSFIDYHYNYGDETEHRGRLFCIGLNVPLLETEDPEDTGSHLYDEYDEFVSFATAFPEADEYHDVYPCEPQHDNAIRDILAGLDIIGELVNENKL